MIHHMCLIAQVPTQTRVPADVRRANRTHNPDGFGLAWREDDTLRWARFGPESWHRFDAMMDGLESRGLAYAAHWRFGTAGPNSKRLAHPFPYQDPEGRQHLLMHNGVLDIDVPSDDKSDTLTFVNRILRKLPARWYEDATMRELVSHYATGSRLLLMAPEGDYRLGTGWREDAGICYSTTPVPAWRGVDAQAPQTGLWSDGDSGVSNPTITSTLTDMQDVHSVKLFPNGEADCLTCDSRGWCYVIDGKRYVDIDHFEVYPELSTGEAS